MDEMMKWVNLIPDSWRNDSGNYDIGTGYYLGKYAKLFTADEERAKQLLLACKDAGQLEAASSAFIEAAQAYGKPFIDWVVDFVKGRELTEYARGELDSAITYAIPCGSIPSSRQADRPLLFSYIHF